MTATPRRGTKRAAIINEIRRIAGDLPAGTMLPDSINDIAVRNGVNYHTARRAAQELEASGEIEIRHGAGIYAGHPVPMLRHGSRRLSREQWGQGKDIQAADAGDRPREVDQVTVQTGQPGYAELIAAPVTTRSRRYSVDGRRVMLATSYLPGEITAGSPIEQSDTGPGGTYARLADLGYEPVRFTEAVRSRMPSPAEADALELSRGRPVFEITRYAYTASGQLVEINVMILDAGSYVLTYEIHHRVTQPAG